MHLVKITSFHNNKLLASQPTKTIREYKTVWWWAIGLTTPPTTMHSFIMALNPQSGLSKSLLEISEGLLIINVCVHLQKTPVNPWGYLKANGSLFKEVKNANVKLGICFSQVTTEKKGGKHNKALEIPLQKSWLTARIGEMNEFSISVSSMLKYFQCESKINL